MVIEVEFAKGKAPPTCSLWHVSGALGCFGFNTHLLMCIDCFGGVCLFVGGCEAHASTVPAESGPRNLRFSPYKSPKQGLNLSRS